MTEPLATRVLSGDARAIARAISTIEDGGDESGGLIRDIFSKTGRAYVIGVTGPPGAGKSTLVDRLVAHFRARQITVGVLAIDPSSPFSGGAVLGDRLRMQAHSADEGVFIRSMATRGHLGGLSAATDRAVLVLDAAGKEIIIIETVGVGQDEVDIVGSADVSVVVLVPGTGDDVQALKAGIMEIADIFVVNKADREGADALAAAIESNLSLAAVAAGTWRPPIIRATATEARGISELADAIERFRASHDASGRARRRGRSEARLRAIVAAEFLSRLERDVLPHGEFEAVVDRIEARELDPYSAARDLLGRAMPKPASR